MFELKKLYVSSLEKKEIDSRLYVRVKNILENLRSALDFCAQAMVLQYSDKIPKKVFFPYAPLNVSEEKFEKRIAEALPDLRFKRPDLFQMIMAMQHFSHDGAKWFPVFMALNNTNKHVHFVPNEITEGVSLEFNGSKIFASSISIGETGSIETDEGILKGPLHITPQNVHEHSDLGVVRSEYWEAIFIEGYGYPMNAYEFNSHCVRAISSVVKQFSAAMP
ncbi:MAG: hypothetical protein HY273_02695 [Gammaproteobacteria bacterium]|nr:hypothetical protein [Gammaproteobacteria bacterium]